MMKKIFALMLTLVMVISLAACGSSGGNSGGNGGGSAEKVDPIVLRASTPTAPEHPWSLALDQIAAEVNEKTGGRYQIDVYYNASLSENSEKTMTEQVMTGALDLGVMPAILASKSFSAFSYPFQFVDRDHIARVCESDVAKELLASTEELGLHSIAYVENGFRQITNNKHPIQTPEDMKGVKIRTPQSPTTLAAITAMGANAVALSAGELYVALSQGTVDGQENALSTIWNNGYYEVQKYCTVLNYNWSPALVAVNSTVWASLSAEDQAIFEEAILQAAADANAALAASDEELIKQLEEKGMEVYVCSAEEREQFKALCQGGELYQAYVDSIGQELLDSFGAAVEACK